MCQRRQRRLTPDCYTQVNPPNLLFRVRMTTAAGGMEAAFDEFLKANPVFETTQLLDELRRTEYGSLDRLGEVFLDHTGGGQYADSQVEEFSQLLGEGVFGNPHSDSPASSKTTTLEARLKSPAVTR